MSRRFPPPPGSPAAAAAAPAAAGHRPLLLAAALSACFVSPAFAQPSGAQVVHGAAQLTQQGNRLVVTTQNGAGTSHSAINWQSFGIPAGTATHFAQPGASSTSINRVLGPNPSAIYGTLTSNGRLVLVNPAGIAVGAGAVVDTAGFTASTLRMSDADALAGRLRFGDGSAAGPLAVHGQVVARGGDVVLIAPDVQVGAGAVVQSIGGDTVLAAGQKVEVTGRGLEGIRLEVKAPADKAVNLGTLKGDSVALFASQLRHSGLVRAVSATAEGGKVVLHGQRETVVGGDVQAQAGDRGGRIDVLGERVALVSTAELDASGSAGGGSIRVGGDYQGANAEVPNARTTTVSSGVKLKADATLQGRGGRVIVWADQDTRFAGRISARGGEAGGDGGFAEVSGKKTLDYSGRADLRAPRGRTGSLLLDPSDITIIAGTPAPTPSPAPFDPVTYLNDEPVSDYNGADGAATGTLTNSDLVAQLGTANVRVSTYWGSGGNGDITIDAPVEWSGSNSLTLDAHRDILIKNRIVASSGQVALVAGGSISQEAGLLETAYIRTPSLLVQSGGPTSLLSPNNEIQHLAASVYSLDLVNKGNLTITNLNNPFMVGSLYGVVADRGVTIKTTPHSGLEQPGHITVDAETSMQAGFIDLEASGNIVASGPLYTYGEWTAGMGRVRLKAGGSISFDEIDTSGSSG